MPAFGYMPVMMIELGLYGLISGLVMQFLRSGKLVVDLYAALVIAMLGGRVITGILRALIFAGGSYSWSAWAAGYFVSCRIEARADAWGRTGRLPWGSHAGPWAEPRTRQRTEQ